jgi:hypothetical protein
MSRWGCGPFDNDTAADFAGELDDAPKSKRIDMLYSALAAVSNCDSHIDASRAEVALAAGSALASKT